MKRSILTLGLLLLFLANSSWVWAISAEKSPSGQTGRAKSLSALIADIEHFAGSKQIMLPNTSNAVSLQQRILVGLQQDPPRHLRLNTIGTIYWGWQQGQAFVQSVVIYNDNNELRLVAAVNDIPGLYSRRSKRKIVDAEGYQQLLRKYQSWGSKPSVVVFAQEAEDFDRYLPLVQRWLQAAMLGFNVDCSDIDIAASCRCAETLSVPVTAYRLNCNTQNITEKCGYSLPTTRALSVPLSLFRQ